MMDSEKKLFYQYSVNTPEKSTEIILMDFNIKEFPVPIVKIMHELDILIGQQKLNGIAGYIAVDNIKILKKFNRNNIFVVNSKLNYNYKRYVLAQMLYLYLFDYDSKLDEYYKIVSYRDKKENKNINQFATNLLIPDKELIKKYYELKKYCLSNKIEKDLEDYFCVPKKKIKEKIIKLQL